MSPDITEVLLAAPILLAFGYSLGMTEEQHARLWSWAVQTFKRAMGT